MNYRPAVKAVLDDLLPGAFPGVTISRAFGFPAYKIEGRIFAFTGGIESMRAAHRPGAPTIQLALAHMRRALSCRWARMAARSASSTTPSRTRHAPATMTSRTWV